MCLLGINSEVSCNVREFGLERADTLRCNLWSLELADYYFVLKHRSGQLNKKANLLLRRNDHKQAVEGDNVKNMIIPICFE